MRTNAIRNKDEVAKLQTILDATISATRFANEYGLGETTEPSVWWVKDEGSYIMACCRPDKLRPKLNGKLQGKRQLKLPLVAYLDGFGKDVDFEKQQERFGGDDFCLRLPLSPAMVIRLRQGDQISSARIRFTLKDEGLDTAAFAVAFK
jgi:hypothetical protein